MSFSPICASSPAFSDPMSHVRPTHVRREPPMNPTRDLALCRNPAPLTLRVHANSLKAPLCLVSFQNVLTQGVEELLSLWVYPGSRRSA